jgi:MFS transporter, Spinster family, sphingosine-1-phosphate transporter
MQQSNKHYLLVLLMVILAFNYVDRLALGIALQDIKTELNLSDAQLGFLTGIAFALFYSVMGLPIARWADRGHRVKIITLTTALWSAAVALCATATSFGHLLLIRVGVAVGEAGCIPPAHSLIADHFTRAERPRAVGIYTMGVPLSLVFGYFAAGWLNQFYGWRTTFIVLGLPGLVLAALAWFTLKEPRRSSLMPPAIQPTMKEVWMTLWANITFRHMLLCFSISSFFAHGVVQWQPAFFIRSYGLQTGEVGSWFALSYGLCGLLGNYCGGALASRYAANNERLQMQVMAAMLCGFGIFSACVYLAPNQYIAIIFLALASFSITATNGPFLAAIQSLVSPRIRAMSIAIIYLFANLIGMGLGPFIAGALSDALRPQFGDESLRYALLGLCPGFVWCTWHLLRASQTVARDISVVGNKDSEVSQFANGPNPELGPNGKASVNPSFGHS